MHTETRNATINCDADFWIHTSNTQARNSGDVPLEKKLNFSKSPETSSREVSYAYMIISQSSEELALIPATCATRTLFGPSHEHYRQTHKDTNKEFGSEPVGSLESPWIMLKSGDRFLAR